MPLLLQFDMVLGASLHVHGIRAPVVGEASRRTFLQASPAMDAQVAVDHIVGLEHGVRDHGHHAHPRPVLRGDEVVAVAYGPQSCVVCGQDVGECRGGVLEKGVHPGVAVTGEVHRPVSVPGQESGHPVRHIVQDAVRGVVQLLVDHRRGGGDHRNVQRYPHDDHAPRPGEDALRTVLHGLERMLVPSLHGAEPHDPRTEPLRCGADILLRRHRAVHWYGEAIKPAVLGGRRDSSSWKNSSVSVSDSRLNIFVLPSVNTTMHASTLLFTARWYIPNSSLRKLPVRIFELAVPPTRFP